MGGGERHETCVCVVSNAQDPRFPTVFQIIIIDDGSTLPHLGQVLTDEIATIPKVKLVRQDRQGLIRSKVNGAHMAGGDVLVYLDSHCECNDGWYVLSTWELMRQWLGYTLAKRSALEPHDRHLNCDVHRLEPLLHEIVVNRKTIAMPIIDVIYANTWEHKAGILERGKPL